MERVGLYLRVSTEEQTVENQRMALQQHCERRGWKIAQTYEDAAISGSQDRRPALDRLNDDVRAGKLSAVCVFKFDRMARSVRHLLDCLTLFREHDVQFISITEGIDTSTSVGRLVYVFLAGIAQFEREILSERVRAGMARAKRDGTHCGRPRKGFDTALALQLHNQGLGVRRIARQVGVSYGTVHRFLQGVKKGLAEPSPKNA